MKRVIVSTSTSCLDHIGKPRNVQMLRMKIHAYGKTYVDGKDIGVEQVANMMDSDPDLLPTASPPSEEEIADFFYELLNMGYQEVFVVCVSASLSKTYEYINNVVGLFASHMTIHVFDSANVSYPEGMLVLEASRMLEADKSSYEIERRLRQMRSNMYDYFVLEDLRNIIRTKRISAPAGFVANLFNIKPLLEVNQVGQVVPMERVRHIDKAIARLCEITMQTIEGRSAQLSILVAGSKSNRLSDYVQAYFAQRGYPNLPIYPIASVTVALLGTSGVGINILLDDDINQRALS